jgi:hypothetical protein
MVCDHHRPDSQAEELDDQGPTRTLCGIGETSDWVRDMKPSGGRSFCGEGRVQVKISHPIQKVSHSVHLLIGFQRLLA